MKILFEGGKYDIENLKKCFGDKFYHQIGNFGYIDVVGYYHSNDNKLYYFLPKLFITENDFFLNTGIHYHTLFYDNIDELLERNITLLNWFRKFLILFYKSLAEYKNRVNNRIVELGETLQLSTNLENNEFTFLDLVLTLLNFYKKNKEFFIFHIKEQKSDKYKKVSWSKTIKQQQPIFIDNIPIYNNLNTKAKKVNNDEILMTYFYSVLNHLKHEYKIDITIDSPYTLIKGERFKNLLENGLYKIKKVRDNYYSDKLKAIYNLLVLFFEKTSVGNARDKNNDFIVVKQYHNVFEDMIDKMLSDSFSDRKTSNGVSLSILKNNQDGKVLDHLFEFDSLFDNDESVFYIGDSKYYKHNSSISENSVYKQFTYAKNVIQYNIDLLHENAKIPSLINKNIRYRDELTEGYSISPNFFIQGIIKDINDFDTHGLAQNINKGTEKNAHFKERLFDRDTLFINYYEINFLFVLNAYTNFSSSNIIELRNYFKTEFKRHFISYFKNHSGFDFYEFIFENEGDLKQFVDTEFRYLIGRIIRTLSSSTRLILAMNPRIEGKLDDKNLLEKFIVRNNSLTRRKEFFYMSEGLPIHIIKDFEF
ncbi:MAG: hypothetical protein K0R77_2131 [Chryseobacterium sp.]|jgi:hypothetical protein|uniref:hypothetical protein n=1 Tax=Chryseobacterium sp. TaxID=1871047 RepID=UPI002625893D|nr:hypothetical protein [Chryseobacterium sp.]MDF2552856.1 hypothetical protein [Chryseobacterium sp.]